MMTQSFVDWPEVWPRSALSAIASSLPAWTSASNWRSQASASNAAYQERNAVSSAGESFSICCSIASTLLMDHLARKYTSLDSRCQPLQMISATRCEMAPDTIFSPVPYDERSHVAAVRRRRCIGTAIGLLLSEIRQEHQNVAHRNHADQFSTLRHAEMSDMRVGHQIAEI